MALLGLIPEDVSEVRMKLTPEQAKREAVGRALALMGSTIGMVGGVMVLSTNPAFRTEAEGAWKALPPAARQNKAGLVMALGLGGAALIYYMMTKQMKGKYDL